MKGIKVLHVCTIPLTAKAFIAPMAEYLIGEGYDVWISCSPGPEIDELRRLGIKVKPIFISRKIEPLKDVISCIKLCRFIKEEGFHIVQAQTSKAGFIGRTAAKLAGVPIVIYTAHDFSFHPYLNPVVQQFYKIIERFAAAYTEVILTDTEIIKQKGIKAKLKKPKDIITVHMGINLERFSPDKIDKYKYKKIFGIDQCPVVGTVARFVPNKGLKCLLRAAALVLKEIPETKFLLVGDGPERNELEALSRELAISQNLIFPGFRDDIQELMALMDVFCLPTHGEGFGVVFAEAMAMKVPVVASLVPSVPEVVENGKTGILVPPERHELFAQALLSIIKDPDKGREMGKAGRERVEKYFDERLMFQKTSQIYQELIRRKKVTTQLLSH